MIFDAHADILTDMYQQKISGNSNSFKKRHLELYKKGGITHSIFVNWCDPATTNNELFDKIFDNAFTELLENSDIFKICLNHNDLAVSFNNNKIGVIVGMEGIAQLKDVNHLIDLYNKGVRHASLTWNEVNKYASGLENENTKGLTKEGIKIIKKMDELGMIIDLTHSNEKTFFEVIENTSSPVIISHGNAKAVCNHIRNYTDDQLIAIKKTGGVIGVASIAQFISSKKENQNAFNLAKHIEYITNLIGIDHVGLGFDFCYYLFNGVKENNVKGLESIGNIKNLFIELSNLGFSTVDIEKIKFSNFDRVVKAILK